MGFMFSCIFSEHMNALIFNNMYFFLIYFSSGIFANFSSGSNKFLDFFTPSSPFTSVCEQMMRILLNGLKSKEQLLDYFGFTRGSDDCLINSAKIIFAYFLVAWVFTIIKSKIFIQQLTITLFMRFLFTYFSMTAI